MKSSSIPLLSLKKFSLFLISRLEKVFLLFRFHKNPITCHWNLFKFLLILTLPGNLEREKKNCIISPKTLFPPTTPTIPAISNSLTQFFPPFLPRSFYFVPIFVSGTSLFTHRWINTFMRIDWQIAIAIYTHYTCWNNRHTQHCSSVSNWLCKRDV